ncbi:hypothetical protein DFH07DRAFT_980901 [Mycena maculata]|uniref:cAMP-independent regulatory protein pac2 n=1 Tax=Mycena maculata TaxID=230809 RepID=A0AAD7NVH5_9AGAR|nr:hypothetical protein DFH07DRAFT_980901 [Mycena maculata]
MQSATCTNLRVRSPTDVRVIFHAVLDTLPMVTRRLDSEERGLIVPGSVHVESKKSFSAKYSSQSSVGIERWTDGIRWGPSRVREHASQELLIKQTYTAYVDTPREQRKWHLIAYFTEESVDRLNSIDDYPTLSWTLTGNTSVRSVKERPNHVFNLDDSADSREFSHLPYVAYDPDSVSCCSSRSTPSPLYTTHEVGAITGHRRGRTLPESDLGFLAPLEYPKTAAPPRRHPVDETALKLFKANPCSKRYVRFSGHIFLVYWRGDRVGTVSDLSGTMNRTF